MVNVLTFESEVSRGQIIQLAGELGILGLLSSCSQKSNSVKPPIETLVGLGATDIVDVHCHIFNADDLPAENFIKVVVRDYYWPDEVPPVVSTGRDFLDLVVTMLTEIVRLGAPSAWTEAQSLRARRRGVAVARPVGTAEVEHLPMRSGESIGTQLAASGEGWDLLGWKPNWSHADLARPVFWYRPQANGVHAGAPQAVHCQI